jgi:hypothetical protein
VAVSSQWIGVKKVRIKCPICDKPDWCGISDDRSAVCCMRIESDKPAHNGGWIHRIGDPVARPYAIPIRPEIQAFNPNLKEYWERWLRDTDFHDLDGFAMSLDVETQALQRLGCAWADRYWADPNKRAWATPGWSFPMRDADGKLIGLRIRGTEGGKWAMKGSRNGLFISESAEPISTAWIVEGPTDTAAALTLGLNALGRPSCSACDDMVVEYLRRHRVKRAVIITDNDKPDKHGIVAGIRGAEKLQNALPIMNCIWIPPAKDLREFVSFGGTKDLIEASIKDLVWSRPRAIAA